MNSQMMQNMIMCALQQSGTLASVVFERINEVESEPADDFYNEREESEKIYIEFPVEGQVAEEPKRNVYGPGGGEVIADLMVTFYGQQGATEENDNTFYVPEYKDKVVWANQPYEVTGLERVNPFGNGQSWGWIVTATRFS